jgi:hypothetical protein
MKTVQTMEPKEYMETGFPSVYSVFLVVPK